MPASHGIGPNPLPMRQTLCGRPQASLSKVPMRVHVSSLAMQRQASAMLQSA